MGDIQGEDWHPVTSRAVWDDIQKKRNGMNMAVLGLLKGGGHEGFSIAPKHYQVFKDTTDFVSTEQYG